MSLLSESATLNLDLIDEKNEIAEVVQKQKTYFSSNSTKNIAFRIEQLRKLRNAITEFETQILYALNQDLNKTGIEAYGTEIALVLSEIEVAIKKLKSWSRPKVVPTPIFHFYSKSKIYPEPYGVALIISPWNYPFNLLFSPLVGAIAAGNCAILKPSELTPNVSRVMADLIRKTFETQYVALFEGDASVSQELLNHKFDYIFYTGGTNVGKIVYTAAAKNLTPVTLELGGKSPCIVHSDANINISAKRIISGKLINSGQTCLAPDYLFVHKSIKHELIVALKKEITAMFGENPEDSPHLSRIVNDRHLKRLEKLLDCGDIIVGGQINPETKYIAPTLIENIEPTDPIMQEEIFGPILPIMDYENLDEVIQFINERPKPLALYLYTESSETGEKVIAQTSSGAVAINESFYQVGNCNLPFGGVGESGIGNYHGKFSFDTFSHQKSVLKRSTFIDLPLRYAPYKYGEKILRFLLKYTIH